MKKQILLFVMIASAVITTSCNDDNDSGNAYPLRVKMTDAPAAYEEVNIDLQSVQVINGAGETITLTTDTGVYNLLEFSNGLNTIIAANNLSTAEVSQIKLVLGTNNTIVSDGVSYPMSTPAADQGGLTIDVNQTLNANVENVILLDFDAGQSVVVTGVNTFKLKPVVRTITSSNNGSIIGTLSSLGLTASVTATSSTNVEYSSGVTDDGKFKISGLTAGIYTLTVTPVLPFLPVIQTGVVVTNNSSTDVGLVDMD
jgi:hypothetical protein